MNVNIEKEILDNMFNECVKVTNKLVADGIPIDQWTEKEYTAMAIMLGAEVELRFKGNQMVVGLKYPVGIRKIEGKYQLMEKV